jgi:hypothetical protein
VLIFALTGEVDKNIAVKLTRKVKTKGILYLYIIGKKVIKNKDMRIVSLFTIMILLANKRAIYTP